MKTWSDYVQEANDDGANMFQIVGKTDEGKVYKSNWSNNKSLLSAKMKELTAKGYKNLKIEKVLDVQKKAKE